MNHSIGGADAGDLSPRSFLPSFADSRYARHWCGGDAALTHVLNTYTLLVPGNEGYFIRTLKKCLPLLAKASDRAMVKRFLLQEGQHGVGHRRFWSVLEKQGYRIAGFQSKIDAFLYRILEPATPLKLRLSMVACVEHINAYLGHEFLSQNLLRDADPELRALFEWHFAEEIEHRHVAYDVLQTLAPGYALRLLGAAMVLPLFYLLTSIGALYLLAQDGLWLKRATWRSLGRHLFTRDRMAPRTCRHIAAYLRPSFHPRHWGDPGLAREAIGRHTSGRPMIRPLSPPHSPETAL